MRILAIETSTKNLSMAIADDERVLAEYKGDAILRHSHDLIPNIENMLNKLKLELIAIDSFAISIGPGSFTGLRIGVSILKGLNLVTRIPIITVPTLDAIAYNSIDAVVPICVIVDAKKKNLYASLYKTQDGGIIKLRDYLIISPEELIEELIRDIKESVLFAGDGVGLYERSISDRLRGAKFAPEDCWYPDAKVIARMGVEKFKRGDFAEPDTLVPMYIYSHKCSVRGIDR